MKLKQMEVFVAVAETKSFSGAAKKLYLTQPTVSAHICALEKELNAKLFDRNTREVCLTDQGVQLYQYAREMIFLENRIQELFLSDQEKEKRHLIIAASTIPFQYLLPDILAKFQADYPDDLFEVRESDSTEVIEEVVNHTADIGFTGTIVENEACCYLPFYEDELVILTPDTEKYRKIQEKGSGLKWMQNESLIMREKGSGTRKEAEKQLKQAGINVEKLHVIANVRSTEAIKRSVKNGIGITVISKLAVQEELKNKEFLTFPIKKGGSKRKLNLVYHSRYPLSKAAEDLLCTVQKLYQI